MNETRGKLEAAYKVRFYLTAASAVLAAMAAHLVVIVSGVYFFAALAAAFGFGLGSLAGLGTLIMRFKQLRHLDEVREHGPYGTQEFVPPPIAVRQIGHDGGRNLWG